MHPSQQEITMNFKESIDQKYERNCFVVICGRRGLKNNSLLNHFLEEQLSASVIQIQSSYSTVGKHKAQGLNLACHLV